MLSTFETFYGVLLPGGPEFEVAFAFCVKRPDFFGQNLVVCAVDPQTLHTMDSNSVSSDCIVVSETGGFVTSVHFYNRLLYPRTSAL